MGAGWGRERKFWGGTGRLLELAEERNTISKCSLCVILNWILVFEKQLSIWRHRNLLIDWAVDSIRDLVTVVNGVRCGNGSVVMQKITFIFLDVCAEEFRVNCPSILLC